MVRHRVAALILLLVLASACSSSKPSAQGSSPSPSPSQCIGKAVPISFPCPLTEFGNKDATGQGLNVTLKMDAGESGFDPTFVKVKPGARVTVMIDPGSLGPHTFTIDGGVNQAVPANKVTTVTFTLPTTGPVVFYCIPHRSAGMQGAFYFS